MREPLDGPSPQLPACWPWEVVEGVGWVRAQLGIGLRRFGTVEEVAEAGHGAEPALEVLGVSLGGVRRLVGLGVLAVTAVLSACGEGPPPASVSVDTSALAAVETTLASSTAATMLATTSTQATAESTAATMLATTSTQATPEPDRVSSVAFEDAVVVWIDEEAQGELEEPNETNLFVFYTEWGKLYQIDVAPGTLGDPVVALYDSDRRLMEVDTVRVEHNGDGAWASRVPWTALGWGSYFVGVSSSEGATGSYTLTVVAADIADDHPNTITGATPVTVGDAAPGVVDYPYDLDWFVFDAIARDLYQIDAALGTLEDTALVVYHADLGELAFDGGYEGRPPSASRVLWAAPISGTYYVAVGSSGAGTGSYTLTIAATGIDDHADTIGEATPVTVGDAVPGIVEYPQDYDVFVFDAVAGELYQIDVAHGTLSDPRVGVHDAHEKVLAFNYHNTGSSAARIFWEPPNSGRYYIEVGSGGDRTGSYTLTITVR